MTTVLTALHPSPDYFHHATSALLRALTSVSGLQTAPRLQPRGITWSWWQLLLSLCLLDIDPATCRRRADGTASSFCIPLSACRTKAAATQQQKPSWLTSRWLLMTTWNIGCLVPHVSGQNSSNTRLCVSLCRLVGSTLVSGGFQETRSRLYFLLHLPNMRDFKANYEAYD